MQPGDKLTAANFNAAYLCKTDDDETTGRIKTDRYLVEGKTEVEAAVGQTLTASTGVILLTAPAAPTGSEGATTIAADPTQGFENGQRLTVINCSGSSYELSSLADPITIPDGKGIGLIYCDQKSNWVPVCSVGGANDCKIIEEAPPAGVVEGSHVYYNGTSWTLGTNGTSATVGTFYVTEVTASTFKIQASGFHESAGHGFTPGDYYWVDNNGTYTNVEPNQAGDVVKQAFFVVDANCLYLLFDNPVEVIGAAATVTTQQTTTSVYRDGTGQAIQGGPERNISFQEAQITSPDITQSVDDEDFTVNTAGIYHISTVVTFVPYTNGVNAALTKLYITVNDVLNYAQVVDSGTQLPIQSTGMDITLPLAVGDVVNIKASFLVFTNDAPPTFFNRDLEADLALNYVSIARLPQEVI